MSPSLHHAYVSGNIIAGLHTFDAYSVFSELTLQLDKDYIADICLYPKRSINFAAGDIIKVTDIPLLIVEILSPTQGTQEVLEKFVQYFQAGVKSCWLVIPVTQTVTVYSSMDHAKTFTEGDVVDSTLDDVTLSIRTIFA
jgi:Uma2 family endonuclease